MLKLKWLQYKPKLLHDSSELYATESNIFIFYMEKKDERENLIKIR